MKQRSVVSIVAVVGAMAFAGYHLSGATQGAKPSSIQPDEIPAFEYDPTWPKRPLPNQWIFGNVAGLAIEQNDHVWVIQRPLSLSNGMDFAGLNPPAADCCRPAPSIIEFDATGGVVQGWGGPDPKNPTGKSAAAGYEWPREHGLFVDQKGNVWTGSDETGSATVTKLTHDGKLIFQKGKFKQSKGNADTENFSSPAGLYVDAKTNETYIADGYHNNRVMVIDADTGAFKRMWGAYGNKPVDGDSPYDPKAAPTQQFRLPVHCIEISRDDLVYVCDRRSNRVQVFQKDGTFVKEGFVAPWTLGFGAVHDIAFSPDSQQRFMYVGDGANKKVWILRRDNLEVLGSFGNGGKYGGDFGVVHTLVSDSKGNLYVGETLGGDRVQKFKFTGMKKRTR